MLKLIKYEFMRKDKVIMVFIISLIINLFMVLKLQTEGSAMFIGLFPLISMTLYIVDIISMYSRDLNNKSGYMLFMTPNSGYKIIVSKLITAILEGLFILLFYFIIILINGIYMGSFYNINYNEVISFINMILSGYFRFNLGHVFVFLITALVFILNFILSAYTAITIRKSIFSEIKFAGFLSFIIFIAINWFTSFTAKKLIPMLNPYFESLTQVQGNLTATQLVYVFLPLMIVLIIQCAIMTVASGYLLEKKINL